MQLKGCHIIFSRDENGKKWNVYEVFHSPSGGKRDDYVSVGFIKFEADSNNNSKEMEARFHKEFSSYYSLTPLSTKITEQFSKNWKLVIELPDAKLPKPFIQ